MREARETPDPDDELVTEEPRASEGPVLRDDDDPETPSDPRRSTGTGRRTGSRIAVGMVAGSAVGVAIGLLVGAIVFEGGSRGFWASVVAGLIFGFLLGGFWGGLSGLGPPEVENDPLPPSGGR